MSEQTMLTYPASSIVVTDIGFSDVSMASLSYGVVTSDSDVEDLDEARLRHDLIIIDFPSMADGRGFSLARLLREKGYQGTLYAAGGLICDQYRHARQSGFDGVLLTKEQANKMPEQHWLEQVARVSVSYRDRLSEKRTQY